MPELPEVEVTRRGLLPDLAGAKASAVTFRTESLRYPLPRQLNKKLQDEVLREIRRRGKYLLFQFDTGVLLLHLGMSGSLRLVDKSCAPQKHDHVDIAFSNKTGNKILRLRDPRRFGALLWIEGDPAQHPLIAPLGIEPLDDGFTPQWLFQQTRGLKAAIKVTLMDSHRIVGIGNIYASESLFRAGIDPRRAAGKISWRRIERLVPAIRETLNQAIRAGGSSLRDFAHSDGGSGYFQLEAFVYGREGEACRVCGTTIKSLRQGQRATFYCPKCQR
ncbi:formamidopyrimidine/5-formyluracil/ 5-hydroxymethyluracil DNA glycosylase [Georgfuchsia toluolica]|uniref:Formamidopyrimidine-DNA glycosylase n=1 Tax=Georgfuchsia toluolica TaxID=424218 RepID=A0A916J7D1_9PROT|nr:bifunctional DNA-formamidopyrimidine glycosylase/DNA-(apurinic or apyrimidinic site) lyase [Georgfuchsia toluolica]CAG4884535.1 formamidopyrimidine/5-formyluracil/ 5-hydroxymethyluracil DNA glycosylase [Georgfuchsia toluolica]